MTPVAHAQSPQHSLQLQEDTDLTQKRLARTQSPDQESTDAKIREVVKAAKAEIEALKKGRADVNEIRVNLSNSIFAREKNKCSVVTLIGLSILGFVGTTIYGGFQYAVDQSKLSLGIMIASIGGATFQAISAYGWDMYGRYKDANKELADNKNNQESHQNHVEAFLLSINEFFYCKKIEKIETFRKCLEHLQALQAPKQLDRETREELISGMLKFLDEDNPLVQQIKDVCIMSHELKQMIRQDSMNFRRESSEGKGTKTPETKEVKSPERKETKASAAESGSPLPLQKPRQPSAVIFHTRGGVDLELGGRMDLSLGERRQPPVGATHDRDSHDTPPGSSLQKSPSEIYAEKFAKAYQAIEDDLKIGRLKFIRYNGMIAKSPNDPYYYRDI